MGAIAFGGYDLVILNEAQVCLWRQKGSSWMSSLRDRTLLKKCGWNEMQFRGLHQLATYGR